MEIKNGPSSALFWTTVPWQCDLCVLGASCSCPTYTTVTVLGRATFKGCSSSVKGGAVSVGIAGRIEFAGGVTANENSAVSHIRVLIPLRRGFTVVFAIRLVNPRAPVSNF